jgi:putative membrane protein
MLWIKAFHLIFVVTWFAGLLYLPRLFVYHAMAEDPISEARFTIMERKLFVIMTIGGIGTILFGAWLLLVRGASVYLDSAWLWTKLVLVAALIAFHLYCHIVIRSFRTGSNRKNHLFFRWLNEIPSVILVGVVILAVVKPF